MKCLVEKREFEIEFPVEEKKENEFKIECLLNHILGGRKKREWIQMRAKRDLRLGNSSGQSW